MYRAKISGLGKAVPENVVTNDDIALFLDTSDEWISTRTGIKSRHITNKESVENLATKAAKEAIENSKTSIDDIDLVIIATVTSDTSMPSTACKVIENLGIKNAIGFDLAAACSGFIYASQVAVSMISSGMKKNVLVIGAETISKVLNWEDRGTCVLFADGAGAAIYTEGDKENKMSFLALSGGMSNLITLPIVNENSRYYSTDDKKRYISMDGREVYKFATTAVPKNIKELLENNNLEPDDIDFYILHQANERIMDVVARKLKVDVNKFYKNIETHGNTSAASIPIALYDMKDSIKKGDKLVLSGFGAGLTWGSMMINW